MGINDSPVVSEEELTGGIASSPIVDVLPKRQEPQQPSSFRGLLQQAAQGVTFGFGDEITAALVAAAAKAGGANFGETYRDVLFRERQMMEEFRAQNPKTAIAAEIGGGLLLGGTGAGRAIAAAPLRGGMAAGAAYGLGTSKKEDPMQTAIDVGVGAGVGFGTSAAIRGAGSGINYLKKSKVGVMLANAIKKTGKTPQEVVVDVDALGGEGLLADVFPDLAEAAALRAGGRKILQESLEQRAAGQQNRIIGTIQNIARSTREYWDNIFHLDALRQNEAAPLYKQAFISGYKSTKKIESLITNLNQNFRGAWLSAKRLASLKGQELPDKMPSQMTLQQLDWFKQGVDIEIDKAASALRGNKKIAYEGRNVLRTLLSAVDDQNPAYKAARQAWAGPSAMIKAQEEGRKILSKDFEITAKQLEQFSSSEKEAFVIGAVRAIRDKIMSSSETTNVVRSFRPLIKERLRPIFQDDAAYKQFIEVLDNEQLFHSVRTKVLSGSPTVYRGLLNETMSNPILYFLENRRHVAALEALRMILGGKKTLSEGTAVDMANMLVKRGMGTEELQNTLKGFVTDEAMKRITSTITLGAESAAIGEIPR